MSSRLALMLAFGLCSTVCFAQDQFLINDRDRDGVYRIFDANHDGVISDPSEVFRWFDGANVAGTAGPTNQTALGVSVCRVVGMGDQGTGRVYRLEDRDNDGDALEADESTVFASTPNASAVSLAFVTGVAFDSQCRMYVANAGNNFGLDGIYRLQDLNNDGDAQDVVKGVPEVSEYVGVPVMGSINSALYGPQEIFFDANDVGYLRNSVTNNHAIFRFADGNNNGRADDAGEFTLFFGVGNMSGVTLSAGFTLEPDRYEAGAMYTLQIAAGSNDQLIRLQDVNHDDDAQDAGEAVIAWADPANVISVVDAVSLANGDVLLTEAGAGIVHRLHDLTNDRDFNDAGELTVYSNNGAATLLDIRQMDVLCRIGDVVCNGVVDVNDLLSVVGNWGATGSCLAADVNCDGVVNVNDLLAVIGNWG